MDVVPQDVTYGTRRHGNSEEKHQLYFFTNWQNLPKKQKYHKLQESKIKGDVYKTVYCGADKSLVRLGRKQARNHIRDARDFNNIETRSDIKFVFLQGKAPNEIHAILKETWACFIPARAKDLSAPL